MKPIGKSEFYAILLIAMFGLSFLLHERYAENFHDSGFSGENLRNSDKTNRNSYNRDYGLR